MATSVTSLPRASGITWSSIFAGTFMFLAIEVTFGVLALAIFASGVNPTSANPVGGGTAAGLGIWFIVLSFIALYFAGKTASRLAAVVERNRGTYYGLVTYGMSVFATLLVTALVLGSSNTAINPAHAAPATVVNTIVTGGWWVFFSMLAGLIASAIGGAHGAHVTGRLTTMERPERPSDIRAA